MKTFFTLIALLFPVISSAQNSIKDNLRNAERSPLFQQKFSSSQITSKGLDKVKLHNGVELQFKEYTHLTRLDESEKFKPLMNNTTVNQYLRSKPTYTENIIQLEDRLIVDRSMKVSIKKGTCQQNNLPASVKELCFVKSTGQLPTETKTYIKNLRLKLKSTQGETMIKDGVTAAEMRSMSDEQLLDTLLNSDDREISMVSVLPTEVHNSMTRSSLWNTSKKIKPSNFNTGTTQLATQLSTSQQFSNVPAVKNTNQPRNQIFPKKYFLTGFTLGREITDTFEVQLAPSTLLTDRYYVRFEYEFSAGFGLRFPFSVAVESIATNNRFQSPVFEGQVVKNTLPNNGTVTPKKPVSRTDIPRTGVSRQDTTTRKGVPRNSQSTASSTVKARDHRQTAVNQPQEVAGENTHPKPTNPVTHADIKISVAPVDVESNGTPAYPAVNLHQSKYFDGKEFVLKFHASCKFKASIPGEDINLSCPTVDFDKSRDIEPVIGDERARLATLWLNGNVTGLTIEAWAGKASIDFGIESNLTNGRIGFKADGYNNTLIANQSRHTFLFEDKNTQEFKVENKSNNNAAFNLNSPSYGFDFELRPVARARFNLDLGIKTLKKTLGPYSLDALSFTVGGFTMTHHEGTVESHIYSL